MSDIEQEDHRRTIYVGNLPDEVTANDLYAFFNTFGEIKSIQIPKDHVTGKYRGFAFIQFDEKEDAHAAIDNYDRTQFMDRNIKVRRSKAMDMKPTHHHAVWKNDNWLTKIQQKKIEDQNYTKEMQDKSRNLGLPVWKKLQKPDDKPRQFMEED